jgi:hypothetical protein
MKAADLRSIQTPLQERYWVVHQTLAHPPALAVTRKPAGA